MLLDLRAAMVYELMRDDSRLLLCSVEEGDVASCRKESGEVNDAAARRDLILRRRIRKKPRLAFEVSCHVTIKWFWFCPFRNNKSTYNNTTIDRPVLPLTHSLSPSLYPFISHKRLTSCPLP